MREPTRFCILLLLLLLILPYQTSPQTNIPEGNVNGKWLKQNSPYYIDSEIKIPYGKKLIIEPGVKVIFTGHYKMIVNGILEAKGNKQDSIYFFSSDTSVGWHGIRFIKAEDFSTLEYCVLKYGKTAMNDSMDENIYRGCEADPNCDELNYGGGAILIYNSNPILSHCTISDNVAGWNGGGIAIMYHSNPEISYCEMSNNTSIYDGGGIDIRNQSNPKIRHCGVKNNHAGYSGGGIKSVLLSNPLIENCLIKDNYTGMGGGLYVGQYSNALIDSSVIDRNIGKGRGGGICFYTSAKPIVKNSTISGNSSPLGGGIYIDEFYNEFREKIGKIDIRIVNVRIENNTADYGGGIWLRDTQGELSGVTICYNKAMIGGGINIEHNPMYLKFSSEYPCNIFMNFARMMGNDLFRLGGEKPTDISLDTFTVKYYSALNAEPVEKFPLSIKNFKLTQVDADLYVNPEGDDSNSGLSPDKPLKSLKIALLRILADSTNQHTIILDKGEYIFTETNDILLLDKHKYVSVKGAGFSDIIFSTDRITVYTPWWITTWALIIYGIVLITVLLTIWNVRIRRIKIKSDLEKKEFEAQKLHEVDEIKTKFFTNISHEFRTPLTLILGPSKQLSEESKDEKTKIKADLIHRSANKLNRLVDELLDFSKIEAGEMKLKACPVNLVLVVKEIVLSFHSLAERKKITFIFNSDDNEIIAYLDKDKIDKIITNVLSNAFKFTPEGGKVEVAITLHPEPALPSGRLVSGSTIDIKKLKRVQLDNYVEISIRDTGVGIPKDQIDKIFDRFYQVDGSHTREHEGTGIGLALTKELIELHKGKIKVESEEGKGSTFRLIFPLGKEHLKPEEICEEEIEKGKLIPELDEFLEMKIEQKVDVELSEKPTLLIVEDNPDVRKYISMILENHYQIFEAKDGEEGLDKSFEKIPDLIISDIMMPKLDGFQMSNKLKTDSRTSHIPIIMLTAKATMQDKINGLEIGADDYIMKPFEAEELKARIKNLLEQRKRLHEHFRKYGLVELEEQKITSVDELFLRKTVSVINEHLSDTSFGIEQLAENLAVSRALLFKKMNSLAGEPPGEIIKRIRLNAAAKLIEKNTGNISEIALEVGFNNPSYFSECFKKQFGMVPSQYHQNKRTS